jgi:hypothetical protein
MAIPTYTGDTNYIAALDTLPNDVGGLTAAQFQAKFDQFGTEFVAWFNATFIPALTAANVGAASATNYGCKIYNSASISIPNSADTVLTFDSELFDNDTMHSTSSNTGRITIAHAGLYLITAFVRFADNATGRRTMLIQCNGGSFIAGQQVQSVTSDSEGTVLTASAVYDAEVNDYFQVVVNQTSGGALDVYVNENFSPAFSAVRIGAKA